jgi:hypothetical protein
MQMTLPRLSLRGLLGLVTIFAVATGMLLASHAWSGAFVTGLAVLLGTMILVAVYRRGETRAFAIGFDLFGITYLWAMGNKTIDQFLLSSKALWKVAEMVGSLDGSLSNPVVPWEEVWYSTFVLHGHLVCCVAFAVVGGLIARALYKTRDR